MSESARNAAQANTVSAYGTRLIAALETHE